MMHQGLIRLSLAIAMLIPGFASSQLDIAEAANAFGSIATVRGMRPSPDGQRVVFLVQHASDMPLAMVVDLRGGKPRLILASE
jgi:hypothetical protein